MKTFTRPQISITLMSFVWTKVSLRYLKLLHYIYFEKRVQDIDIGYQVEENMWKFELPEQDEHCWCWCWQEVKQQEA